MNKNLITKNNFQNQYLKKYSLKTLRINFQKIIKEINKEVNSTQETINILSDKFKFNFNLNDLKKFRKFKTIAIIGMGGSILGAQAIHNFLEKKIIKKTYFFNDLNEKKILNFKNKENLKNVLFIIISK